MAEVSVVTERLKAFAGWCLKAAEAIKQYITGVTRILIFPGDFYDAESLKLTLNTAKTGVSGNLTTLRMVLLEVGEGLYKIIDAYEKGEDWNELEANALNPLLKKVAPYIPGVTLFPEEKDD